MFRDDYALRSVRARSRSLELICRLKRRQFSQAETRRSRNAPLMRVYLDSVAGKQRTGRV